MNIGTKRYESMRSELASYRHNGVHSYQRKGIVLKGVARVLLFTEALAEFQHVNCMIVQIWEVKRVACCARAETFTEAVASVASMVATPLVLNIMY